MTLHTAARQALDALDKISRWTGEFPDTGRKHEDGSTMSYAFCFGSNGERDFMRQVAARGYDTLRAALSAEDAQPVAWVLTEQLEKRETTCNGRLWFSDPVNSAWTPLYAAPTAQAAPATAPADELMAWRLHFDNVELRAKWDAKLPGVEPTDRDLSAFAVGTEVGFKQARDFERQDWSAAWHALKRAGVHPGRTYDRIEEVIDRLAAERDALKAAAQPAAPAPVVQPLPADLIEYMRGHLMRERRKLDGFVSVGYELPRAAKYDRWLAAMEGDTQAAPVVPAGRLHTDGYFTWNRRDGYVLDQKLPCDFYLAAPAAPAPAVQPLSEEAMKWRKAVQEAYGWLWHTNNEPMAPVPMWSPEQAAYQARKCLRELLTTAERGEAINAIAAHMDKIAGITAAPTKE